MIFYYVLSANTAAVLAKDGIVATMEKVLSNIGFTPSIKLRLALNIISYLSKNSKWSQAVDFIQNFL